MRESERERVVLYHIAYVSAHCSFPAVGTLDNPALRPKSYVDYVLAHPTLHKETLPCPRCLGIYITT